jgi:hypothetical protein
MLGGNLHIIRYVTCSNCMDCTYKDFWPAFSAVYITFGYVYLSMVQSFNDLGINSSALHNLQSSLEWVNTIGSIGLASLLHRQIANV